MNAKSESLRGSHKTELLPPRRFSVLKIATVLRSHGRTRRDSVTRPAQLVQAAVKETAYRVVRRGDLRPFHELRYLAFGSKASATLSEAGKLVPIPAGAARRGYA